MSDEAAAPPSESPLSGLRETLRPQLRLFLSVDIVGSTAFKQRRDEDGWFDMVLRFYQYSEGVFMRHWELGKAPLSKQPEQLAVLYGEAPVLWKTIGDEVAFSKRITHPAQVMTTLHAWIAALDDLRLLFNRKPQDQLDVKATAWLADFPLRNREVALRTGIIQANDEADPDDGWLIWRNDTLLNQYSGPEGSQLIKDYVGPSIDTGFRLAAGSSPRRLSISIELAYVIAREVLNLETDDHYKIASFQVRPLILKYDQMTALKGVLGGSPYPMVWIDVRQREPLHQAEDDLRELTPASPEKIKVFAEAFMAEHPGKLCVLFMREDASLPAEYGCYPDDKIKRLLDKEEELTGLHAKWSTEQSSMAIDDEPAQASVTGGEGGGSLLVKLSAMRLRALLDGAPANKKNGNALDH